MVDANASQQADLEFERRLARGVAIGAPVATVLGALGVLFAYGPASALLVLGAGALLAAVIALWTSLRSLTGDAPLEAGFDDAFVHGRVSDAEERKRAVLRALKDLEHEKSIGKIDEADFAALSSQLRAQAKSILREIDDEIAPMREKAEKIAREHLRKKGLGTTPDGEDAKSRSDTQAHAPEEAAPDEAHRCPKCATRNDADATFCKKCATRLREAEPDDTEAQP